jgi:hypothetical protein
MKTWKNEKDVLSIVYWGLSEITKWRFGNSNRRGKKLSSECHDRYVKEEVPVKEKQKNPKAKGERKGGAFRGGGKQA